MKYALLLLLMVGCAQQQPMKSISQELIVDAKIQHMGRNEVIDAVKQCETAGLRAIPIYAKRYINGYSVETVVEVTCGPRYSY